jgi:hypothetical protein
VGVVRRGLLSLFAILHICALCLSPPLFAIECCSPSAAHGMSITPLSVWTGVRGCVPSSQCAIASVTGRHRKLAICLLYVCVCVCGGGVMSLSLCGLVCVFYAGSAGSTFQVWSPGWWICAQALSTPLWTGCQPIKRPPWCGPVCQFECASVCLEQARRHTSGVVC